MLSVFKKYQGWLIMCECGIAVLAMALIYDGVEWPVSLALFFGLSLLAFIVLETMAGIMHRRILCILYLEQRPKEFIAAYRPLTELRGVRKNILFSMRAYLSNAYAAMGDFNTALAVLEEMPELTRNNLSARALISGNRCSFLLDMGDVDKAEMEYEIFFQTKGSSSGNLRKELESTAQLLGIKFALARGSCGKTEEDTARELYKKSTSALHKTHMQLLLGQIYLQTGRPDIAKEYLKGAVKGGNALWAVKRAAAILSSA